MTARKPKPRKASGPTLEQRVATIEAAREYLRGIFRRAQVVARSRRNTPAYNALPGVRR